MNKSIIYNFSIEEIKNFITSSNTVLEVLRKIGYSNNANGCRSTLFNFCKKNNLLKEIEDLKNRSNCQRKEKLLSIDFERKFENDEVFIKNSKYNRGSLKKRIIKEHLLEYKCALCGNTGNWNGKELVLQLDHINGINNDNRLENLRFLCPNCHSQTETYSGKSKKNLKKSKEIEIKRFMDIQQSNIDFSKFGWVKELSKMWNIAENKAGKYVRKHFPDFYKNKCFVRS